MGAPFTPGPWRIGDAGRTIFGPPNGNPSPETVATVRTRANAPLIAAAPELYAELKALRAAAEDLLYELGNPNTRETLAYKERADVALRLLARIDKGGK